MRALPLPEGFRPIPNWPGYGIDKDGNVLGKRGKLLKPNKKRGYVLRDKSRKGIWLNPSKILPVAWPEYFQEPAQKSSHKCHDCGAPTPDYRCRACQSKWRQKYGVSE